MSALPSQGSVLSRNDSVPAGIAAQLEYFQGGADVCGFGLTHFAVAVKLRPDQAFMAVPDTVPVCLYGYAHVGDVVVDIRDPAGNLVDSRRLRPGDLDRDNYFPFRRIHSDPLGIYSITATQNEMTAATTIDVRSSSSPQFIGFANNDQGQALDGGGIIVKPGETVRVAVGGYEPYSTVQMRIYHNPHMRETDGETVMDYLTSHPVTVDAKGGGIWELRTEPSDPDGECFMLHNENVTRRMYPAPDAPEAPSIRWDVTFCLFSNPIF